jgi:hypothetical protein
MSDELGMAFDAIRDVAGVANDIFDTLNTVQDICDGTCAALGAASVIPGAAAITGPVISVYMSMRPTLVTVIDVGGTVVEFMNIGIQVIDAADALMEGNFEAFASEAGSLAQQAMND